MKYHSIGYFVSTYLTTLVLSAYLLSLCQSNSVCLCSKKWAFPHSVRSTKKEHYTKCSMPWAFRTMLHQRHRTTVDFANKAFQQQQPQQQQHPTNPTKHPQRHRIASRARASGDSDLVHNVRVYAATTRKRNVVCAPVQFCVPVRFVTAHPTHLGAISALGCDITALAWNAQHL